MGNFFKKVPADKFDEGLIQFLKTRKLQHINESIEMINDQYPTSSTLKLEEYYDVFANSLEDRTEQIFILLENSKNVDGKVDIYESLATLIVFCGEEFPVKLRFIFEMFDFDKSGEIEIKELIITFQTSIRALCKLVYIEPPSLAELEHYANRLFSQVDTDRSRAISFQEFNIWMSNSWELQDFLLMYAMIQTYDNAERRTKERLIFYSKLYENIAGGPNVQQVDSETMKSVLAKELSYMSKDLADSLIKTLEDTSQDAETKGKGIITKNSFKEVMNAWSAFDGTDINNDNQVSLTELKFLLYAYEGDVPDAFRVNEEMQILDKDGSGYVSRTEWIQYLCLSTDHSGKAVFRGNLKRQFNQFDKDNSGSLNMVEIKLLLKDNLKEHAMRFKHKSMEDQEDFDGMIDTLAKQIVQELNKDDDQNVTWEEFKHFMEKAYTQQDVLKQFLSKL